MSSILTNNSAMTALMTLRSINNSLNETQTAISTGKAVSTAKQNAAIWSVAAVMTSDVAGYKGTSDAIALGSSTIGVARSGAETIVKLMDQLRERINLAQSDNVDKAKIQVDVEELVAQIGATIDGSQFNGQNLLTTAADSTFLSGFNRTDATTVTTTEITVLDQGTDIATARAAIEAWDVDDDNGGDSATALTEFEENMQIFVDAAAALGSYQKRIEIQGEFVKQLSDSLKTGIGALTDADMEETSARLQALQVQQQLGTQSLSIANQQPQSLLSLFR